MVGHGTTGKEHDPATDPDLITDLLLEQPLGELRLVAVHAFVVLADERHYGRAAARLYLTPSGLSRQISALEKAVRVPLLTRTSRSVELTLQGQALLPHARRLLQAAAHASSALLAVPTQRPP